MSGIWANSAGEAGSGGSLANWFSLLNKLLASDGAHLRTQKWMVLEERLTKLSFWPLHVCAHGHAHIHMNTASRVEQYCGGVPWY